MNINNIAIETLNKNNTQETADCIAEVFCKFEPVTLSLGLDLERFKAMSRIFVRKVMMQYVCFTVRESESGKIVGFLTSIDMEHDIGKDFQGEPNQYYDILEKLTPDIAMTTRLEEPFLEAKNFSLGECLHLFQCGVLPEYRGLGIAKQLVEMTIGLASEKGYKYLVADCTSDASKSLLLKFGFTMENSLSFHDFQFEGKKPFKEIEGAYYLMVRKINQ